MSECKHEWVIYQDNTRYCYLCGILEKEIEELQKEFPVKQECPHSCNPINNPCWHYIQMITENANLRQQLEQANARIAELAQHNIKLIDASYDHDLRDANIKLHAQNAKLQTDCAVMWSALERLAKLGNGDQYGNSEGNIISRDALRRWESK